MRLISNGNNSINYNESNLIRNDLNKSIIIDNKTDINHNKNSVKDIPLLNVNKIAISNFNPQRS